LLQDGFLMWFSWFVGGLDLLVRDMISVLASGIVVAVPHDHPIA
jgi:hypothetical protein